MFLTSSPKPVSLDVKVALKAFEIGSKPTACIGVGSSVELRDLKKSGGRVALGLA